MSSFIADPAATAEEDMRKLSGLGGLNEGTETEDDVLFYEAPVDYVMEIPGLNEQK